jgi:uncharacterized PurR-regulated membrane protein YhhQ (DUF165 family)/NADPH-dependent 7-cyano-7-deazaguanine reductase QueF
MSRNRVLGAAAAATYLATIVAANWAINRYGAVPVWPGLAAPAGVYFAGAAFTLRDLTQEHLGRLATLAAIAAGAGLSYLIASPRLAAASAAAFAASELADFAVYQPLRARRLLLAVLASNVVGSVVDSALFLALAFGNLTYLPGQVVGKTWTTVIAVVVLAAARPCRPTSPPQNPDTVPCVAAADIAITARLAHRCPFRDETDRGHIRITWRSAGATLELHSLAAWLRTYRSARVSHEELTERIRTHLADLTGIEQVTVQTSWRTASTQVEVTAGAVPGESLNRAGA